MCLTSAVALGQGQTLPSATPTAPGAPAGPVVQTGPSAEAGPAWRRALVAGNFEAALAATDAPATQAYIRGAGAERRGGYAEAEQQYRASMDPDPAGDAALALADLLNGTGRRDQAVAIWHAVLKVGQLQRTGPSLGRAARAAHRLGQVRLANAYFQTAANLSPDDPQAHTAWGDLFLDKDNAAEARASYETALKADAAWVPALVGMARVLADSNPTASEAAARQAIAIDAGQPDAWLLLASAAIDASKRDEGRTILA
nr:hypothetical protein [Acidobacteriota bacterium]